MDDVIREFGGQEPTREGPKRADNGMWRQPVELPDQLLPVKPFHDAMLPQSLRRWVADIAERLQCPADYPAVAAIVVLAGIVGRKIGIRPQKCTTWLVIPNLWGAVIGRPGVMKTPAIQEPLRILQTLERDAKRQFDLAVADHETASIVAKAKRKARENELNKAIRSGKDVERLARELRELEPYEPVRRRYMTSDVTVEQLGVLLNENPNGMTLFRDELAGFL